MVSILFWVSLYALSVSSLLLFLRCSGYSSSPYICAYNKEISNFYSTLIDKLNSNGSKVSCLFHSTSLVGAMYRHYVSRDYLLNTEKLKELNFSERELLIVNEQILPGFMERVDLFDHLNINNILLIVNIGVIVGSLI